MKRLYLFLIFGVLSITAFGQTKQWSPPSGSDLLWTTASNWNPSRVPTSTDAVQIAWTSLSNADPILKNTTAEAKSILISNSKTLTINNATLIVEGTIDVNDKKLVIENNSYVDCNDLTTGYQKEITVTDSEIYVNGDFDSDGPLIVSGSDITADDITFKYNGSASFSNNSTLTAESKLTNVRTLTFSESDIVADYFELDYNSVNTFSNGCKITIENDFNANGAVTLNDVVQIETNNLFMASKNGATSWDLYDDSYIIVHEILNLQQKLTLYNNASLIQTSDDDENTDDDIYWGELAVYRKAENIRDIDYVYWSSPVDGTSLSDIGNDSHRYKWIPTISNDYGNWERTTETMETGKGYIVRGGDAGHTSGDDYEVLFSMYLRNGNRIHNGPIDVSISKGTYNGADYYGPSSQTKVTKYDDNWNLIGNPYPSAISADKFLSENTSLEGGVRIWTHTNGLSSSYDDPFYAGEALSYNVNDYITYNTLGSSTGPSTFNGYIASGQGFFVLMRNDLSYNNGEVNFTNDMRTYDTYYTNTEFYRTDETSQKSRIWLELIADETKSSNTMLLGYINGATEKKDRLYDAIAMDINTMGIYSLIDEEPMVIQGRPLPFVNTDEIPLSLITTTKDLYSIGIKDVDGAFENNQDIYLEDLYENTIHNLKDSAYAFTSEAGTFNDRFILRYQDSTLSVDDVITDSSLKIIATENFIKASTASNTINSIIVYDILGRVLYQANGLNTTQVKLDQLAPTQSPLIVKATLINGTTKTQKVIY